MVANRQKRVNMASLAGETVEAVPGHSVPDLVRVRPEDVAPTPLNTRTDFGTDEELTELGESLRAAQVQPIVVVRRVAYLSLWPEHEAQLGAAKFVLVAGERRYRAALKVTLEFLDAIIRESLGESREAFVDAMVAENLDRKDLDPIEEAHAVEEMVGLCGGNARKAAQRFRRTPGWVSQRRALLKLTPDLQRQVRSGELPIRIAREVAGLSPAEQPAAAELAMRPATPPAPDPLPPAEPAGPALSVVPEPGEREPAAPTAPAEPAKRETPRPSMWSDLDLLAEQIRRRLPADDVARLVDLLAAPE